MYSILSPFENKLNLYKSLAIKSHFFFSKVSDDQKMMFQQVQTPRRQNGTSPIKKRAILSEVLLNLLMETKLSELVNGKFWKIFLGITSFVIMWAPLTCFICTAVYVYREDNKMVLNFTISGIVLEVLKKAVVAMGNAFLNSRRDDWLIASFHEEHKQTREEIRDLKSVLVKSNINVDPQIVQQCRSELKAEMMKDIGPALVGAITQTTDQFVQSYDVSLRHDPVVHAGNLGIRLSHSQQLSASESV